jgi:hypothetical protein
MRPASCLGTGLGAGPLPRRGFRAIRLRRDRRDRRLPDYPHSRGWRGGSRGLPPAGGVSCGSRKANGRPSPISPVSGLPRPVYRARVELVRNRNHMPSPRTRTAEQISNSPTEVGRPPPFQGRESRGERRSQMARLESIRRRGTPGRPGDLIRGIAPQPPVTPRPPKVPKPLTPSGQVQGRAKPPPTRKRRGGGGADEPA